MTQDTQVPAAIPDTYFVDDVRFPFCKGCGHTNVMRKLNDALTQLQLAPQDVALVTDIGCIGLADGLFKDIHTVHTTHGRSTGFATGIALADAVLAKGSLHLIVLIGDGGAMIGLQHLVHAAMLNVNITVLICNNFVYGMTGGQGSGLTPECFVTATTPRGNMVPPADLCGILIHSNAPHVVRALSTDADLAGSIRDAISYPGFAAVEILELCTEFAVPQNQLTGKKLKEVAEANGWRLGVLAHKEHTLSYEKRIIWPAKEGVKEGPTPQPLPRSGLGHQVSIIVAGSAGEKIQSAAAAVCKTGIASGLYAAQKNDNPVTQGSGFSIAEVTIGPGPIRFTGIEDPDILLAVSADGLKELHRRGSIASATRKSVLLIDESLDFKLPRGRTIALPLRSLFSPAGAATAGLLMACMHHRILPEETAVKLAEQRLGDRAARFAEVARAVQPD